MTQKLHVQKRAVRLHSLLLLTFRNKLLIAAVVGGGTAIVFPAASAAGVASVVAALGTIGLLAWTGLVALAPVASAALVVPALMVVTVIAAVAGVRCLIRIAPLLADAQDLHKDAKAGLDERETDGGPAAPARRRVARRRVRRFDCHRSGAGADVDSSEDSTVLADRRSTRRPHARDITRWGSGIS